MPIDATGMRHGVAVYGTAAKRGLKQASFFGQNEGPGRLLDQRGPLKGWRSPPALPGGGILLLDSQPFDFNRRRCIFLSRIADTVLSATCIIKDCV